MTVEQLILEGRRLERPCVLLTAGRIGQLAAVWYECDDAEIDDTGSRCWITVDARLIPGFPRTILPYVSVYTDEETCEGGRVVVSPTWPSRKGTPLYATPTSVIAPIDAVFLRGSSAVI